MFDVDLPLDNGTSLHYVRIAVQCGMMLVSFIAITYSAMTCFSFSLHAVHAVQRQAPNIEELLSRLFRSLVHHWPDPLKSKRGKRCKFKKKSGWRLYKLRKGCKKKPKRRKKQLSQQTNDTPNTELPQAAQFPQSQAAQNGFVGRLNDGARNRVNRRRKKSKRNDNRSTRIRKLKKANQNTNLKLQSTCHSPVSEQNATLKNKSELVIIPSRLSLLNKDKNCDNGQKSNNVMVTGMIMTSSYIQQSQECDNNRPLSMHENNYQSHSNSRGNYTEQLILTPPVKDTDYKVDSTHICYGKQGLKFNVLKSNNNGTFTPHWEKACELCNEK